MGSLADSLRREYIQKYGVYKWHQHLIKINDLWGSIETYLDQKCLCYNKVRVYQDGLPVCGNELQIIQDIANKGGKNHLLIVKLVNRGAALMGTEDPVLLMKEYQLIKNTATRRVNEKNKAKLNYMSERDAFIAQRINDTLKDDETGILFLGMLHKVVERLAPDIIVECFNISAIPKPDV